MKIDIVLHPFGDWEGLYIDGKLVQEGHSIGAEDIVSAINSKLEPGFKFSFNQFEADIKKEKYSRVESDGTIDEWEDYPSNMPDELPKEL